MRRSTQRRRLGTTAVSLTQLGFGGASIGGLHGPIPDDESLGAIRGAWESGVRYFDTAPWYGRGLSEHRVGDVVRTEERNSFVLSTKVGRLLSRPNPAKKFDLAPWPGGLRFAHVHDYTYSGIMRSIEDSFQRLSVTEVDLLLVHDLDGRHHDNAALAHFMGQLTDSGTRALSELKSSGVVRAIGAGINESGTISQFMDSIDLDFFLVALCYTLLDQTILGGEMERAEARGLGFIVGGVFNSGILATGPVPGATYNYAPATENAIYRTRRIADVAQEFGVPLAAAALQFPLGRKSVASVIPGSLSAGQSSSNAQLMDYEIPDDFWDALVARRLIPFGSADGLSPEGRVEPRTPQGERMEQK